jgi:adenosylcobinamide-GDP ribazoletransferase
MTLDDVWLNARAAELKASFLFLTRLRYGPAVAADRAALARAGWAFPIVGLMVGVIGGVVYLLAHRAGLPPWPSAALAVAATMTVSGCLHEAGLAATVDGFGGGKTAEQKRDIMRDSRIGAFGVCALVLSIVLRVSALASLPTTASVVWALLAAHAASRAMLPVFMVLVPPARRDGSSYAAGEPPRESAAAAAILGVLILLVCLGPLPGLAALIVLAIAGAVLWWLGVTQIEGQTAELMGAVEQVGEIAVLLVALG